jgi:hypothetical protein
MSDKSSISENQNQIQKSKAEKRQYRKDYYRAYYELNKDKFYRPKKVPMKSIEFIEKKVVITWD